MVDVSHTSKASMMPATALSRSPVIASHSSARALCDHPRNLDDEQLDAIRDAGGVVPCVALGGFVTAPSGPCDPVTVKVFVHHIDFVAGRIGIDHVGIASDFDGSGGITGWNDASETSNVTLELVTRGYSASDIEKIWGGNLIRDWKAADRVAEQRQVGARQPEVPPRAV